jgi:hypothetical protein
MERYISHYRGLNWIQKIEIEKETDKSYWIEGRRHTKHTNSEKMFETYTEAKDFMINEQLKRIEAAKRHLTYLENDLAKIKTL